MKRTLSFLLPIVMLFGCNAANNGGSSKKPGLLPHYNDTFYSSVLSAAEGIGGPFLLQQHYLTDSNIVVSDSTLSITGIGIKYTNTM